MAHSCPSYGWSVSNSRENISAHTGPLSLTLPEQNLAETYTAMSFGSVNPMKQEMPLCKLSTNSIKTYKPSLSVQTPGSNLVSVVARLIVATGEPQAPGRTPPEFPRKTNYGPPSIPPEVTEFPRPPEIEPSPPEVQTQPPHVPEVPTPGPGKPKFPPPPTPPTPPDVPVPPPGTPRPQPPNRLPPRLPPDPDITPPPTHPPPDIQPPPETPPEIRPPPGPFVSFVF